MNADTRVRDARTDSPEAGLVRISILSKENGGVVSDELLNVVKAHIMRDDIRMLTDTVEVVACTIVPVNIIAKLRLMSATPTEILETIKSDFRTKFTGIAQMGEKISTAWIVANLFVNGVQDVELLSPTEDVFINETECASLNNLELIAP
jgi:phage-related baseplate assembly protein